MLVLFLVFLSFSWCYSSHWCSSKWIEPPHPPLSIRNGPLPGAGLLPSVLHFLLVLLLMIQTPPFSLMFMMVLFLVLVFFLLLFISSQCCSWWIGPLVATPLWGSCEVATHTPENGTWESSGTPKNSESDYRRQNTLHWSVFYTIEKVLKCRCPKWPRMSHLDICSTSYGRKKGRESNWQFDSQPLKVGNRPDFGACR